MPMLAERDFRHNTRLPPSEWKSANWRYLSVVDASETFTRVARIRPLEVQPQNPVRRHALPPQGAGEKSQRRVVGRSHPALLKSHILWNLSLRVGFSPRGICFRVLSRDAAGKEIPQ